METAPVVCVLGATGSGRSSLVSSLLKSSNSAAPRDAAAADALWSIKTKYYTADVALRVQDCASGSPSSSSPQFQDEAIVLVFDVTCPSSFSAIQNWASRNSESTEDAGVRLVVATHMDLLPPSSSPSEQLQAPGSSTTNTTNNATTAGGYYYSWSESTRSNSSRTSSVSVSV
jgi:GTPase SAR1 family protein